MHSDATLQRLFNSVAQRMQLSCDAHHDVHSPSYNLPPPSKTNSVISSLEAILKSANSTRDMCAAVAPLPLVETTADEAWNAAHAEQARKWAEDALSRVREIVAQAKVNATAKPLKIKKPEYTPLLEKYFEYNAYPSAPDRTVLARKCMMTPRQIEVWPRGWQQFQNHRNRAKKERKVLRRLTNNALPPDISLGSLEVDMPCFTVPDHGHKATKKIGYQEDQVSDKEERQTIVISPLPATRYEINSLDPPRPPYAFPNIGHHVEARSFPAEAMTLSFPAPTWYRKPAISPKLSKTRINMEEFVLDFAQKLHLRTPASKKHTKSSSPWYSNKYTIPSSAPHPALVRSLKNFYIPDIRTEHLSVIPALVTHPRSPSPASAPITLTSDGPNPPRRKVARLPKSFCKIESTTHRRGSPSASEVSSARSSSSPSDSSSLSPAEPSMSSDRSASPLLSTSSFSTPCSSPITSHTSHITLVTESEHLPSEVDLRFNPYDLEELDSNAVSSKLLSSWTSSHMLHATAFPTTV